MTINALSAAIGKTNVANGDDAMAIYQALLALRYGVMAKALDSTIDATAAEIRSAMRVLHFDDLASRLQALPDTPGGTGKVLATFSAGAAGVPSQQMPDATVTADLDALGDFGLALPQETWLYAYETSTAPGVTASRPVLTSPQDIAKIRTDCPLAYTQDGIDYYGRTTGEGKDQKTTYFAVYQSEGAYCAKDSDISDLSSDLKTQLDGATVMLNNQSELLGALSGGLTSDIRQNRPSEKLARDQQQRSDERQAEALLDRLQNTPTASSSVRKG